MGLIKAITGAVGGVLADQWKEYFYCDAIPMDTLVVKGQKRTSSRSSNTKGEDNIISNGSVVAVNEGQCMIIVEQGKVVELCAEAGAFTWDASTEPSIFAGSLGKSILETFKAIGRRFTFGGDTGKDQRVYYFNTKEIMDNKFGTANPVPFRVVDSKIGLDIDVSLRCSGIYSYKIVNPILFYTNVCANVRDSFKRSEIDGQLKIEFIDALQPAVGALSDLELRPNQIIKHNEDLKNAMQEVLNPLWADMRGLEIARIALNSVTIPEEDQKLIKEAQRTGMFRDPGMAGAHLVGAQGDAMKTAAGNAGGAMTGFMGMGMAANTGAAATAQNFFAMAEAGKKEAEAAAPAAPAAPAADAWTCPKCGSKATGKFCTECGEKKPVPQAGWTCPKCGKVNLGKFCQECGEKKPADAPLYRCDKCGWVPEDPKNPPKFCPECGDKFDENDIQK